jgi:hypothetical protein
MATKTIPQLIAASSLTDSELFEISQNGSSRKVTLTTIKDGITFIKNGNIILRAETNSLVLDATSIEALDISLSGNDVIIDLSGDGAKDLIVDCGTQKTIELQETVWDDLRIVPGAFKFAGTSDPSLQDWQPGGSGATLKIYKFAKDDQAFFSCQMPHTYKLGTNLMAHVHWTPADRGNEENGKYVGWKIDCTFVDIHGTFPSTTTLDLSSVCSGIDDYHELTPSVSLDGSGITGVSAMIMGRIYRSDTGTDDTWVGTSNAQSPGLLELDFHYQIDTLGSRQEKVK